MLTYRDIAKIAKTLDSAVIHISTDYVFDGENSSAYTEENPTSPIGIYAMSKLQGEKYIQSTLTKYYILRAAWMYGIRGNNFVRTMLRLFQEKNTVKVIADQWGSPTYAKDLAGLLLHIINVNRKNYGIYHYTNEGKTNWYGFAKEIYRLARRTRLVNNEMQIQAISTEEYPTKAKRPKYSYLSKEKIKKALGISIRSWQEALQECIDELGKAT